MAKVFVKRSDLSNDGGDTDILAYYDDNVEIDPKAHGDNAVMLTAPASAIAGMKLVAGWRDKYRQQIIAHEATNRIYDVFPEYSQRNSIMELDSYIIQFGTDVTKWPAAARARKGEIDRCWNYVNSVRSKATAMSQGGPLPANPSSDANWPMRISQYQTQ